MAGGASESDEDAGLTAAERGTAVHKVFELLDFREAYEHRGDRAWFISYAEKLVNSGVLSGAEAEAAAADAEILLRFANSDLLARAAASDFLMKEAPFNMKLPYGDTARATCLCERSEAIHNSSDNGLLRRSASRNDEEIRQQSVLKEEIVVQGVIDCLFAEGEGLVIADYKTGWFDVSDYDSEAERIRTVYGEQLRLYRRAAETIFKKPVIDCLIYMARAGVTVDI